MNRVFQRRRKVTSDQTAWFPFGSPFIPNAVPREKVIDIIWRVLDSGFGLIYEPRAAQTVG